MLWIPTTLTEREFWAQKIYGVPDPERDYPSQYGGKGPYDRFFVRNFIAKRPPLSPFWEPFWKDYGFSTEVELDAFLNQYIFKLKNFVWENALNKSRTYVNEYGSTVTIPEQTIQTVLALHQMEYEHYLGPIKYALKYDKGGKVIPLHIPYATLMLGRSTFGGWEGVLGAISSCGSTTRQSIFITLYDGTKIQVPSKGPTKEPIYGAGAGHYRYGQWCLSLKEILEIAKLPNVISIEASDTPYPNVGVYNVAPTAWDKAKQQIYTNYVKYMQSPPPTTQPGTQPPGAPPSGAVVTSKTWTWIAIGSGAILLLLLLTRRK
jgi:hypothetical protein